MLEVLVGNLENLIVNHSYWGFLASFVAGVLSSFTPCIYPLIPITVGIIGAYSLSSRRRGFLLSLVFVLGISVIYTSLGVICALLGIFIGNIVFNPVAYGILAVLLFILGLAMFDINLLPAIKFSLTRDKFTVTGRPFLSLFTSGMIAGIVAIPCIFPIVGAILSIITLKNNVVYGAANLFFFSLGYGLILIVLGTFTSFIWKLPKSGSWLIILKKCFGIILILIGGYFALKTFSAI
jgi:thiol:disulfide interchange protein